MGFPFKLIVFKPQEKEIFFYSLQNEQSFDSPLNNYQKLNLDAWRMADFWEDKINGLEEHSKELDFIIKKRRERKNWILKVRVSVWKQLKTTGIDIKQPVCLYSDI